MNESNRDPRRRSRAHSDDRPKPRPRKRSGRSGSSDADQPTRSRKSGQGTDGRAQQSAARKDRPKQDSRRAKSSSAEVRTGRNPRTGPSRARRPAQNTRKNNRPRGSRPASGQHSRRRKALKFLGIASILTILALAIAGGAVYASIARDLPDPEGKARGRDQTSVVHDRNGEVLAQLFAEQNRTDRALSEIPQALRQAVIATEDNRYYAHKGIDPIGIARALWVDIRTRSTAQGGSTITQQYVKNAFVTPERTLKRKLSEAILAYRIEQDFSKDKILELYLNTIYFGHGAYGVESAAQAYFGKSVTDLDIAESAMIAGVIKSPGRYSPYLDPEAALGRRATVLRQMADQGMITEAERSAASTSEPVLAGLGRADTAAPYFMEYVKSQLIDEFGAEAVFRGGISVTTTLDLRMQRAAEQAVAAALDREDDPSAALVAIDPRTGEILAMVGGRDFSVQQFNVATQGRRQPGSAFKPFVLAAALEGAAHTESTFAAGPGEFRLANGQTWSVTGASGRTTPMRLREAMEKSINSVFAKLILDVGAEKVVETAHAMGIESEITPVPAIALGGHAEGVSPLEMASAYGTLAAGGTHAKPFSIASVTGIDGEVLTETTPALTEAIDPAIAYITTDILRGVISRGTGSAAEIGRPAAGKTGTTQAYRDAWFVGYTPELVTAVWVGYAEEQKEMRDVHGRQVTGGSFPAEIWASFMKSALEGQSASEFERPGGLESAPICRESGETPTEWCTDTGQSIFIAGRTPDSCSIHTGPETVAVPDLIGTPKERAIAQLTELGLEIQVTEEELRGVPAGIVGKQDPAAGTEIEVGSTITLVVSSGTRVAAPPTASFTISVSEPILGQEVTFDASASKSVGKIVLYIWEFGDGTEAEGKKVTHSYLDPGIYDVVLWITDSSDQTSSVSKQITVR